MSADPEMTDAEIATVTQLVVVARHCAGPLPDVPALTSACVAAVREAGFDVVAEAVHAFTPHGASVALLLAQSHIIISTWPEFSAALVDLAVCGRPETALTMWNAIEQVLVPSASDVTEQVLHLESSFPIRPCELDEGFR